MRAPRGSPKTTDTNQRVGEFQPPAHFSRLRGTFFPQRPSNPVQCPSNLSIPSNVRNKAILSLFNSSFARISLKSGV